MSEQSPLPGARHGAAGGDATVVEAAHRTTVRLPAGHGEGGDSSPELLVDGQGEKTGSAAVFF
jgi:hypothetical protein